MHPLDCSKCIRYIGISRGSVVFDPRCYQSSERRIEVDWGRGSVDVDRRLCSTSRFYRGSVHFDRRRCQRVSTRVEVDWGRGSVHVNRRLCPISGSDRGSLYLNRRLSTTPTSSSKAYPVQASNRSSFTRDTHRSYLETVVPIPIHLPIRGRKRFTGSQ